MRVRGFTIFALVVGVVAAAAARQATRFVPPPGTRTDVAIAIVKMGHPDPAQRIEAVRTIQSIPPAIAAPAARTLVALLADEGAHVQEVEPIIFYPADEAVNALSSLGGYAVDAVIEALESPHYRVRVRAVQALGGMKDTPRAAAALVQVLSSREKYLRTLAAIRLADRRDQRAFPALSAAVLDTDPSLRGEAAVGLGVLGNPAGVAPILAALKTITGRDQFDTQLQSQFADALGALAAPESEEALAALVQHRDDRVRRSAITAVGRVARRMRPELVELLDYPMGPTAEWAAAALREIRDPASVPVVASMLERSVPGRIVALALSPFGPEALEAVALRLQLDDENVRRHAVAALGRMIASQSGAMAQKYQPVVLSLVTHDPSPDVRRAAIEAWERFPGSSDEGIEAVVRALDDARVAQEAIRVLRAKTQIYRMTTAEEWRAWRASALERRSAIEQFWTLRIPVSGQVVHPDGRAAAGVLVALIQLGEDESVNVWPIREALTARTDAAGAFVMHVQPAMGVLEPDRDFVFVGWLGDKYRFLARHGEVARYRFTVDSKSLDTGALTIYPTLHPPGLEPATIMHKDLAPSDTPV